VKRRTFVAQTKYTAQDHAQTCTWTRCHAWWGGRCGHSFCKMSRGRCCVIVVLVRSISLSCIVCLITEITSVPLPYSWGGCNGVKMNARAEQNGHRAQTGRSWPTNQQRWARLSKDHDHFYAGIRFAQWAENVVVGSLLLRIQDRCRVSFVASQRSRQPLCSSIVEVSGVKVNARAEHNWRRTRTGCSWPAATSTAVQTPWPLYSRERNQADDNGAERGLAAGAPKGGRQKCTWWSWCFSVVKSQAHHHHLYHHHHYQFHHRWCSCIKKPSASSSWTWKWWEIHVLGTETGHLPSAVPYTPQSEDGND